MEIEIEKMGRGYVITASVDFAMTPDELEAIDPKAYADRVSRYMVATIETQLPAKLHPLLKKVHK